MDGSTRGSGIGAAPLVPAGRRQEAVTPDDLGIRHHLLTRWGSLHERGHLGALGMFDSTTHITALPLARFVPPPAPSHNPAVVSSPPSGRQKSKFAPGFNQFLAFICP